MATDSRPKLAIMATMVMALYLRLVKPWDCFMVKAQTTSRTPATSR
jgi:hypothetical protein